MRTTHTLTLWASAAILAAAVAPLRSDGDTAQCRIVTGSLASHVNDPVAGDEAFFKLPNGPSNVMLLLDNSGSMRDLPQCESGDFSNTGTSGDCTSPPLAAPSDPASAAGSFTFVGTCLPATDPALTSAQRNASIAWMESVTPVNTLADPGHTPVVAGTGLTDNPPWSKNCLSGAVTDNHCLFDPKSYYVYNSWSATLNGNDTATRDASDTDAALPTGCKIKSGTTFFDMGSACTSCMTNHGYYFYRMKYRTSAGGSITDTGVKLRMSGRFLNANPPKYVTARFVAKDIAWTDPNAPKLADQLRLGLTTLRYSGSNGSTSGGNLIVPLGPNRANSFPYSFSSFQPVRQLIIDSVNGKKADGVTAAPGAFKPYDSYTPIGSALFQLGQYFAKPGLYTSSTSGTGPCQVSCTYAQRNTVPSQCQDTCHLVSGSGKNGTYQCSSKTQTCSTSTPYFGNNGPYDQGWQATTWVETAAGTSGASWAVTGNDAQGNPIQCTECWSCQKNSIVVITDGMPNQEITFPTEITGNTTIATDYARWCGNGACSNAQATNPQAPKIAEWIHTTELRPGTGQGAKHAIAVHTVGFSVTDAASQNTLKAIAGMGGGTSAFAGSQADLLSAVWAAVNTAIPRESSFSAASANSLQTIQTAASDAYLTRFLPNDIDPAWEGHLFQGALFDEFLNGCDTTKTPANQPTVTCPTKTSVTLRASFGYRVDANGNALCDGVYLLDSACDIVKEDPNTGFFVKQSDGVTPAAFAWDAGEVLSNSSKTGYVGADGRKIFTWIGGVKVDLATADVATLKPYLNVDATWCTNLLTQIKVNGGTDPTTECAKQIIHFVRGWDVMDFDGDGCGGPGRTTNATSCPGGADGEERNRANDGRNAPYFWKLGDVFHSSPAVITAPIDSVRCDTGYEKQCVPTIRSPSVLPNQTSNPPGAYTGLNGTSVDAYERYRLDNNMRRRVILVGANDGMLHAFDGGLPTSCDSHGVCSYSAGTGTGTELWAFIPPDLLPRLRNMMSAHQYMVDGSVMVRDVWVDGGATGTGTKDHVKQKDEFHTVAIFGERSGGTQYTALDVTTPDDVTKVKMLWTFPQPLTTDAFYMGQSWSDFAPRPPPVGPVRIADATDARSWTEQWVVMLSGGYDPALTRGRAVFMVDVWTGSTLWRYTNDTFQSQLGFSGGGTSMFPVPGAVAMVDMGDPSAQSFDMDGFFDTGTWGDLGGNLFVARFWAPGVKDPSTGLVTNWYAARAFEEQRQTDDTQNATSRSPFYFMTSNAFEPNTRSLRTFVGSGNRERLMQQGSACGPDNLLGCCQSGCSASATTADAFGACGVSNTFACTSAGVMSFTPTSSTNQTCGTSATCTTPTKNVSVALSCGTSSSASASGAVTCDASGTCPTMTTVGTGHELTPSGSASRNRFYGIWSYGGIATKVFSDQASARVFDANRFTDKAYTGTCTGTNGNACSLVETTYANVTFTSSPLLPTVQCTSGSKCKALPTDPGWFYEYGHACPASGCVDTSWTDEKTGAGASVVLGCTLWNGMRPYGQASAGDPCTNLATPITYGYSSDYVTGVPTASCGYTGTNVLYRAAQRSTTAPPSAPLVRVTVNAAGKVAYSTLQLDSGAPPANTQVGVRSDLFEPVYWLEVPRDLHICRHVPGGSCQ